MIRFHNGVLRYVYNGFWLTSVKLLLNDKSIEMRKCNLLALNFENYKVKNSGKPKLMQIIFSFHGMKTVPFIAH